MESISFKISGIDSILLNNPQTVDPFNPFSKQMKAITSKRSKTDEDLLRLRDIEVQAKLYFDDELGIYVPSTWVTSALAGAGWKQAKISKAEIRSAVFATQSRLKLIYSNMAKVKGLTDVSRNPEFVKTLLLKQGQVRVAKCAPQFHNWSFTCELEFDPRILDRSTLVDLLTHSSHYGGFGDFRPTYGRAEFQEI